jgi:hypothetical protein
MEAGLNEDAASLDNAATEEEDEDASARPLEWSIDTLSHMAAVGDADGLGRLSALPTEVRVRLAKLVAS